MTSTPGLCQLNWSQKSLTDRSASAMVYDSARGEIVLFGGLGRDGRHLDDMWIWNGSSWMARTPASRPSARSGHTMAYDAVRGEVVLFGGESYCSSALADTWVWNGSVWAQRSPATRPAARSRHVMAFDAGRGEMVMFGGIAGPTRLDDTWVWNGATWSPRVSPSQPAAAPQAAMAYDAARAEVVLYDADGATWTWNGTAWIRKYPAGSPGRRSEAVMAYDPVRQQVIFTAGYMLGSDTWSWNGTNWIWQGTAPFAPRVSPSLAFDVVRGRMILFGGLAVRSPLPRDPAPVPYSDTWTWDGSVWTDHKDPAWPRLQNTSMAYDSARSEVVLFGFRGAASETWAWSGVWTKKDVPSPPLTGGQAIAFDATRGEIVLHGMGLSSAETWIWNGTSWAQRNSPNVPPSGSGNAVIAMAYDAARRQVVLVAPWLRETWVWNGLAWTKKAPVHSPGALLRTDIVYDPARSEVVLSAGNITTTWGAFDTWVWDGTDWTDRQAIPTSTHAGMAYDASRQEALAFGFSSSIWNGTTWTPQSPGNSPIGREYPSMAYDGARGNIVLYGGNGMFDTWTWAWESTPSTIGVWVYTTPPGVGVMVDGTYCSSSNRFVWRPGSTHSISVASPVSGVSGGSTRYFFSSWSDGGGQSHSIAPSANSSYFATFSTQYLLTRNASPAMAGFVNATPSPADGFYPESQQVQLTAVPNLGYTFLNWSDAVTGTANPVTVTLSGARTVTANFVPTSIPAQRLGIVRADAWSLDRDGDGAADRTFNWGVAGSISVTGDWNGNGKAKAGFFKDGLWYLDYDGDAYWDKGTVDRLYGFGWPAACVQPLVGDWNGDGKDKVGVFCNGLWYLDYNGNGTWDGPSTDRVYGWGWEGVKPLVGDWNGDGRDKIGFFINGFWYLDYNGDGNWTVASDRLYGWGWNGVTPLTGDWNGDGKKKIGFFINGFWYLDYDGNGVWDNGVADKVYQWGWAGVTPLVGDWNGDGKAEIGIFDNGIWYLDGNRNGKWDGTPADSLIRLGQAGDTPVTGAW